MKRQDQSQTDHASVSRIIAFPVVGPGDVEQDSPPQGETLSAGGLSDEQLGRAIIARYHAGLKAEKQANDRFISAGRMLIEAKSRVSNFKAFLRDHCNGLSHSRAYELIKIANGQIDEVRAQTNARKRQFRMKRGVAAAAVRSGTDRISRVSKTSSAGALASFKVTVNTLFPRMDDATRQAALAYATGWRPNFPK
jgi:hypothetical protein